VTADLHGDFGDDSDGHTTHTPSLLLTAIHAHLSCIFQKDWIFLIDNVFVIHYLGKKKHFESDSNMVTLCPTYYYSSSVDFCFSFKFRMIYKYYVLWLFPLYRTFCIMERVKDNNTTSQKFWISKTLAYCF